MPLILKCQKCGGDMPPLDDSMAALLRGQSVEVTHEVCPGDEPAEPDTPTERHFEVRVSIVEVEIVDDGEPAQEELAAFRAGVRAPNLSEAMRPLAEALGVEWLKVEKHAGIADPR